MSAAPYRALAVPAAHVKNVAAAATNACAGHYIRLGCVTRMRNASLLRPQNVHASAAVHSQADPLCSPHIFHPEGTDPPREIGQLFNLRLRPGYYNTAAKAA